MQKCECTNKAKSKGGGGRGLDKEDKLASRNPFDAILEPTAAQLDAMRQGAAKETIHMTRQIQSAMRLNRACKLISDSL